MISAVRAALSRPPCNVVVRAAVAGEASLQPVADEAAIRLRAALDSLQYTAH